VTGSLSTAVLVPTFRRPVELRRCLEGIEAQSRRPDRVVVAVRDDDAASHAVAAELASRLPLETVTVTTPGQVAALNAGLAAVTEEIVAITDDDAVPRPSWLDRIERLFLSDQRIGAVGGRDWVRHGQELVEGAEPVVGRVLWYGRFVGFHHLGFGPARDVDFLKGANMAFRRVALPGFDTALRGSGAEQHNDWAASLHVSRGGWRVVYDPEVAVDHFEADRGELDPRVAIDARVAADFVHNQTYTAVRYLSPTRAAVHVAFALLIGTTAAPGLALTVRNLLAGTDGRTAWRVLRMSLTARLAGVRSGLASRGRNNAGLRDQTLSAATGTDAGRRTPGAP
jgi:glycosyltransferase involved in cell wall biosynthesis